MLSRQLGADVARNNTAAVEERPAPAGGKGTLTVVDNRTGKKYTVSSSSLTWPRPCISKMLLCHVVVWT